MLLLRKEKTELKDTSITVLSIPRGGVILADIIT
jgi:hypothetical protein